MNTPNKLTMLRIILIRDRSTDGNGRTSPKSIYLDSVFCSISSWKF